MIDWANLAANAAWVMGCSIALATLSYASWQASTKQEKLRTCLAQPAFQKPLNIAGVLFCAGLAGTSDWVVEVLLWSALGILFATLLTLTIRRERSP